MKVSERILEREQNVDQFIDRIDGTVIKLIEKEQQKAELRKISWSPKMLSRVNINEKIATQENGSSGYCYINLPLVTKNSNVTISWSVKILKR